MGWCSGTYVFDDVCEYLLDVEKSRKEILRRLIEALRNADWDCEMDSRYYEHPAVQEIMRELNPEWFEDK